MAKTIGACLIVKNEAPIIRRCLDSIRPLVDFVLVEDTGSIDGTPDVVGQWLNDTGIAGAVIGRTWRDFATNRSWALESLRNYSACDYALTIDADEVLDFDKDFDPLKFKESMEADLIDIECHYGSLVYLRSNLVLNAVLPRYKGVVHEFLETGVPITSRTTAKGIRNVPIQDGCRSQDTEGKFIKDAALIEQALETEQDSFMCQRYTYYLAQCYRDAGRSELAEKYYAQRGEMGGWPEEAYVALLWAGRMAAWRKDYPTALQR
ncbi:MAG: glycosyltransferase family 2 protein, partial [Anaerolineaceae bacterium]|nr:glycosyltransferase family 2 protein [Anaerolineaceae bacterium]